MSHLPIWSFFEQSNTPKNEFRVEIWKRWSYIRLVANDKGILKIIDLL